MKVRDIQNAIKGMQPDEDINLCIKIRTKDNIVYGGTPVVKASSLMWGFDWDSGKLIITPSEVLYKNTEK